MPEYENVVFVAPAWRRVVDETTSTVRFEAIFDEDEEHKCTTKIKPVQDGVIGSLDPVCRNDGCAGECELVSAPDPHGTVLKCVCMNGNES